MKIAAETLASIVDSREIDRQFLVDGLAYLALN